MLELLALIGCVVALGYVLYGVLVIAFAVIWIPLVLIWAVARVVLLVILAPLILIWSLIVPDRKSVV